MPGRPNVPTSFEMTELDNDDVSLLDNVVHPFDYKGAIKTRAWVTLDRAYAYSVRLWRSSGGTFPQPPCFVQGRLNTSPVRNPSRRRQSLPLRQW